MRLSLVARVGGSYCKAAQSHLCHVSRSLAALQVWDVCAQGARGASDRRSLGHLEPLRDLLEDLRRRHKDGNSGVQQA